MSAHDESIWSVGARATFAASALAVIAAACNAVLGNAPGDLADADAAALDAAMTNSVDPGSVGANVDDAASTSSAPPSDSYDDASSSGSDDAATNGGCAAAQKMCGGECVDVNEPANGCAAASCSGCNVPNAVPACAGGACAIGSCTAGFGDCNRDPSDGCEADFSKPSTCGGCHTQCNGDTPSCASAGGAFACTKVCPLDAPMLCGKECVNLATSVSHCGACATACAAMTNATVSCVLGVCEFACHTGDADCDGDAANGCEASLQTDPANCGACGVVCQKGGCAKGVCKIQTDDAGSAADAGGGDTPDAGL
jgi:hypothetical protein